MSAIGWRGAWRLLLGVAVVAACTGDDPAPVTPSSCIEGETCGPGLSCVANTCVALASDAAAIEAAAPRRSVIGVWGRGLLAYWPFDGDARDYSGNDFDLDVTGVSYEEGIQNRAVRRDTKSIIQRAKRDDLLNLTGDAFTVQIWVNADANVPAVLLNKTDSLTATSGWRIVRQDNPSGDGGFASVFVRYADGGVGMGIVAPAGSPRTWSHVVFVRSESTGEISTYLDGKLANHGPIPANVTTDAILRVGESVSQQDYRFTGLLDEIAIWNRALSPVEISDLYNGGAGFSLFAP